MARPRPAPLRLLDAPLCGKHVENGGVLLVGNAHPGVANLEVQDHLVVFLMGALDPQHQLAALGELDRVFDQVHQDLTQPAGVADEGRRDLGSDLVGQLEALLVGR